MTLQAPNESQLYQGQRSQGCVRDKQNRTETLIQFTEMSDFVVAHFIFFLHLEMFNFHVIGDVYLKILCFFPGHAHLTDFNIATIIKDGERATALAGTKPYMGKLCLVNHVIRGSD